MKIEQTAMVPKKCAELIEKTLKEIPDPDMKFLIITRRAKEIKEMVQKEIESIMSGEGVAWKILCDLKRSFENEIFLAYQHDTGKQVGELIQGLVCQIENALEESGKLSELSKGTPFEGDIIITKNDKMLELIDFIMRVAAENWPVLILGETGTGKELIARALHYCSPRRDQPFEAINCAAIPSELLESELFGYKKGAFTGAYQDKVGLLRKIQNGTLFLDEIGEMPPQLQAKILRVIQERRFRKIGDANGEEDFKGCIVSATNRDLHKEIAKGTFRKDLFYRIGKINIEIPPLRERPEDIKPLCDFFLGKIDPELKLSEAAIVKLMGHRYPGNIRELQGILEKAYLLATLRNKEEKIIDSKDIKFETEGQITMSKKELSVERKLEDTKRKLQKMETAMDELRRLIGEDRAKSNAMAEEIKELHKKIETLKSKAFEEDEEIPDDVTIDLEAMKTLEDYSPRILKKIMAITIDGKKIRTDGDLYKFYNAMLLYAKKGNRRIILPANNLWKISVQTFDAKWLMLIKRYLLGVGLLSGENGDRKKEMPLPTAQPLIKVLYQLDSEDRSNIQANRAEILLGTAKSYCNKRAVFEVKDEDLFLLYDVIINFALPNGGFRERNGEGISFSSVVGKSSFTRHTMMLLERYLLQRRIIEEPKYKKLLATP